jgi:TPP-dependent pyruvate/acetoin dehydrogenase alpha subunit
MAGKQLPKIRSGMADLEAPAVEAFSDDDYRRATALGSILSPDGSADRAGVPALEPAALRECYRTMLRIRTLGDRLQAPAHGERVSDFPTTHGYEAAIVGAVAALQADDVVAPGRRGAGAALWRGHPLSGLASQLLERGAGKEGVPGAFPRSLAVLPPSRFTATQLAHATGIAWAMKMQAQGGGPGKVVLAFLDREATSAEDFHSGLNFAGVFQVPVVFVCMNAAPAGTVASVETVSETIAIKALAYGIRGTLVDGSDLFAVFAATRAAAARARAGEGATLVEAAVADASDPLDRVRRWLLAQKLLDAAGEGTLRREVDAEVEAALAGA